MNVFEDIAALVALGGALVASLAALYARRQAKAAKRANEIALHDSRLRVYNVLSRYRVHVTGSGPSLKEEEVWKFLEAAELSEFYYPAHIPPRLKSVFDRSLRLLSMNEEWRSSRETEPNRAPDLVKSRYQLVGELRYECERITNDLKPYLRVGDA
ncbi:MAG: hypothetical protein J0L57_14970 [Burkholderiales bacterium]|nr:hypothetical protein [Burkholderiales bacterium]